MARYGEEKAQYLIEQFTGFAQHYKRLAFISTPVPKAGTWEAEAKEIAREQGWTFDKLPGDLGWLGRLLDGNWSEEDFLILKPGQRVRLSNNSQLIAAEPA